jgi:glycosyltransferase involved in cell wall biosynthesis
MTCVAIVPAKDRSDSIVATVQALQGVAEIDEILVIDDASTDDTATLARQAGAEVLELTHNLGKGGAVTAGVEARPDCEIYVLIDADLGDTAVCAGALLDPVSEGQIEMAIAIPVAAGGRGGFGIVKRFAGAAIMRATSRQMVAPLSGQRAIVGDRLRSLQLGAKFGLEVAMTIDLLRLGVSYQEIALPIEHHHTGRTVAGFRHRAGQGLDICRVLVPRIGLWGVTQVIVQTLVSREHATEEVSEK